LGPIERSQRSILADSDPIITIIARKEAKVAQPLGEPAPEDAKVVTGSREIPLDAADITTHRAKIARDRT
jgi:hypothetical protein